MRRQIKTFLLLTAALCAAQIVEAQTWVKTTAPVTNWTSIASSADGSKLVAVANGGLLDQHGRLSMLAGPICMSTNSGFAWYQTTVSNQVWQSVACSEDGNIIAAVPEFGNIYVSSNSGETWMPATNAPSALWGQVAVSGDGSTIIASIPGGSYEASFFYISTNSGNNWSQIIPPMNEGWSSLAISHDGSKMIAGANGAYVYFSTNSGSSWIQASLPNIMWGGVATSADGTIFVAAANYGGAIYVSTNSGATWLQTDAPIAAWQCVAMSANGTRWVALDGEGEIYTSPDFGVSWIKNAAPSLGWTSVTCSQDGTKMVAVVNGNGIYIPMLGINASSGNAILSWPSNSFNFTLQQSLNAAMTSWVDVTNLPTFNLTTLQYELTIPHSNNSGFYRLKSH